MCAHVRAHTHAHTHIHISIHDSTIVMPYGELKKWKAALWFQVSDKREVLNGRI